MQMVQGSEKNGEHAECGYAMLKFPKKHKVEVVPLIGVRVRGHQGWQPLVFSFAEAKMAKVPDLFEDLKNCYR